MLTDRTKFNPNVWDIVPLLILLFVAVLLMESISLAGSRDAKGPPESRSVMLYVLSDRSDNSHWYKDPADLNPLKEMLEDRGYSVDIVDRLTLPSISAQDLALYRQIWILEGDWDDKVEVTPAEAEDLYQYYKNGGGIWISFETTNPKDSTYGSWNEDALVFSKRFGVDWCSYATGVAGGKPVFSDHPIFRDVLSICFDDVTGCLCSRNKSVVNLWNYSPTCQGVAVLDGRPDGEGRAVFDSGWVMGYAYLNKNDDLLFAENIAGWLSS